ncbi:MAG: hypothetical protein KAS78_06305, partial [Candidatus Pacebacteria bacterium]|nr:hypothetical protein [Candidatus Paceibacterota bacterium]
DWRAFFEFIEEQFENKIPLAEIKEKGEEQFPNKDWRAFFEFIEEQFENKIPLAEIKEKGEEQFPNYMECTRILYPALHAKYAQMPHEREVYIVKNKATDK